MKYQALLIYIEQRLTSQIIVNLSSFLFLQRSSKFENFHSIRLSSEQKRTSCPACENGVPFSF